MQGCDCWGLVRLVSREQYQRELPRLVYDDADDMRASAALVDGMRPDAAWRKLDAPVPGAILLLRIAGLAVHCGLVLSDHLMLHTLRGHHAALDRYTGQRWGSRIDGAYLYG
jgi:cell wall-associated NlpC family hydrolase